MKYALGLGASCLLVLGTATESRAQFVTGFPGGGFGFQSRRTVIGVSFAGGAVGFGGFGIASGPFIGPFGGGYYYGRPGPIINNISIIAPPPPVVSAPPIIIQQPLVIQQPVAEQNLVDPIMIRPRNQQLPLAAENAPIPGDILGGFRPIRPEDRAKAMQPAQPDKKPAGKQPAEPERLALLIQGRQAFADREYGRALRFFKQAVEERPDFALAHFLLAQAQFAVGKYRDAVVEIHAGLKLDKDWPNSRFKAAALYGPNPADFTEHLTQLRETLKRQPQDAVLLFLCAYQLWFDGQEDEARRLFGQARKLVTEPRFIDLFLIGPPAGPVVAR